MAWIYLAELEELPSPSANGSGPLPTVRTIDMPNLYYYPVKAKDNYRELR